MAGTSKGAGIGLKENSQQIQADHTNLSEPVLGAGAEMLRRQIYDLLTALDTVVRERRFDIDRGINLKDEVGRFEESLILLALRRTGGSQKRAARILDLKLSTLNSKIKHYGISTAFLIKQRRD